MNDENTGVNEHYPTGRSTAGRPHGRDDSTDSSSSPKTPPRSNAAARTGGCAGSGTRPVESSTREVDTPFDPDDEDAEILEAGCDAGDPREQSQLAEQLRVASNFDAAEGEDPVPETLDVERIRGAHWIRFELDSDETWLASNHAVKLEGCR